MITLLTGENSFELQRALDELTVSFDGTIDSVDGSELELRRLPDLLMGASLFADKRLVIIKDLSSNKQLWADIESWLERVSDDIHLVLVEPKPDKRTRTYKALQKQATVREFHGWTDKDRSRAELWVQEEATRLGAALDKKSARALVARVGADQWALLRALEKLTVLDAITEEVVEQTVDVQPVENIFQLFDTALRGDTARLRSMLDTLRLTEDPYQVFGLLSGQAFQLAALQLADKPAGGVAKDLGAHPFVMSKLEPYTNRLGRSGVKRVIAAFAHADRVMKSSSVDPWVAIEQALQKIAYQK